METNFNFKWAAIGAALLVMLVVALPNMVETLDASEVMVIQSVSGELKVYTDPGPKLQWFGTVTTYPRQSQYQFTRADGKDTSIKVQFNDGGKATLLGSVNWEMPLDPAAIIKIHKYFRSPEAIEKRAVIKMMDSATYLAGPMMSSMESVSERRGELVNVINDQAAKGVYVTKVRTIVTKDELTKETKEVNVTEIVRGANGLPLRQQGSILEQFDIRLQPLAIEQLDYDDVVKKQIAARQQSTMSVQLSQAAAKKAEQDAITAEAEGKSKAATARWNQETIKAQKVTEAEQQRDIAILREDSAAHYKKEQILVGEGDAERKRLLLAADGALAPKLQAYIQVQTVWAEAFAKYGGSMVPNISMGGSGAGQNSAGNVSDMVSLLTAKTAKDLALDKTVTGK